MWDTPGQELIGSNVYLDTSFSLQYLQPQQAADLIRRHGVDKVCFGSDWPWADQERSIGMIGRLGLSEKETRAILMRNAAELLGL